MLKVIKSINITHILGLLIGNIGYEYAITGAFGFNPVAFLLAMTILILVLYVMDKLFRTNFQKKVKYLDVWMQPEDGSLSDVEKDMLKKYREAEKKVTENIQHEIESPIKTINNKKKVAENILHEIKTINNKKKVYI